MAQPTPPMARRARGARSGRSPRSDVTLDTVPALQASARPGVTPGRRRQHSVRDLFELVAKQLELGDLALNGGELLPDQAEKSRTERRTRPAVHTSDEGLELL